MPLSFVYWNINPIAFQLGETEVRWYGLLFPVGFIGGYFLARKMFKHEGVKLEWVDNLFIIVFVFGMLGARLAHVFLYDWAFFKENPSEIFKTWHGGLASHGGTAGVMLGLLLWAKIGSKRSFLWVLDKAVVCAALLAGLIRLGNLLNSEIYGIETTLPWGFIFARQGETLAKHPTQLYEAISYFLIFAWLCYQYFNKKAYLKEGYLSGLFGVLVFSARFLIEFIKNNQSTFEADMPLNMGQILSIPFIWYGFCLLKQTNKPLST